MGKDKSVVRRLEAKKRSVISKAALAVGVLGLLLASGCNDNSGAKVEPSPETTPWLYPEPQIELLESDDVRVRGLAIKNLTKMGAKAEPAIPALEKLLNDEDPNIRDLAQEALATIRADAH